MSELYPESMKTPDAGGDATQETNAVPAAAPLPTDAAATTNTVVPAAPPTPPAPPNTQAAIQNDLLNTVVKDENSALNVMVGYLTLAQKRGSFAINESAKIYECIQIFCRGAMSTTPK